MKNTQATLQASEERVQKLTDIINWMSNGFGIDYFENLYDIEMNEMETNND